MMRRVLTALGILRPEPDPEPPCMASGASAIVRRFAEGDERMRHPALSAYRDHLPHLGARGTPEMRFMSEVSSPAPDATLMRIHRAEVLAMPIEAEVLASIATERTVQGP